jgi:D-glycero-alpha-D-manno-heptose-7-phosphate kinase
MIISKTPFRISFFGGGTDYPVWYRQHGGAVLSTTIDKYCYISCRVLPPFFDHKFRIVYSKAENTPDINSIQHPSVRETLKYLQIENGLEIHHDADLPARTGLGSSSAFTVGLLNALYALKGQITSHMQLAQEAIHIEQNLIKENVGSQDQSAAAFGGFNKFNFFKDDTINVTPITISAEKVKYLEKHFLFFFTGIKRMASDIAQEQINKTKDREKELQTIFQMVNESLDIVQNLDSRIKDFGKLLDEAWRIKRNLTTKISNPFIDNIYSTAIKAGALGGKLVGAGGGGFILFFVEPHLHNKVKEALKDLLHVPISFDRTGSQIIFYNSHKL